MGSATSGPARSRDTSADDVLVVGEVDGTGLAIDQTLLTLATAYVLVPSLMIVITYVAWTWQRVPTPHSPGVTMTPPPEAASAD